MKLYILMDRYSQDDYQYVYGAFDSMDRAKEAMNSVDGEDVIIEETVLNVNHVNGLQ